MKRTILFALLASALGFAVLSVQPAFAQKNKPKKKETHAIPVSTEEWTRVRNKDYKFSLAIPKDWSAFTAEHPDPDIEVDMDADKKGNDFNAIEVNREAGISEGAPYIMAYTVAKHHESWAEYGAKLTKEVENYGGSIVGADTTYKFHNQYPGYDVTYQIPNVAAVRSIVFYANGMRYGIMFTTLDDPNGKNFKANMPRFERLMETFQLDN